MSSTGYFILAGIVLVVGAAIYISLRRRFKLPSQAELERQRQEQEKKIREQIQHESDEELASHFQSLVDRKKTGGK